jgi:uncharacterized protein YbjT (DUF2867 family)
VRARAVARRIARVKILVVGATGALGRPVCRKLAERGIAVRALARHLPRDAAAIGPGIEAVRGDLVEPASLAAALAGCDRVLAAAHGLLGRGRWRSEAVDDAGHRALVQAARAAGVQRFVYVSGMGVRADHPVDFFRTKHRIEGVLAASGLPHVVLRPSAFMDQHVHLFNGVNVLRKGKAQLIGPGRKPRNFVAAEDVAEVAVHALLDEPMPEGPIEIGGPDHCSNSEVAALYARLAGLPLRIGHLPAALARAMAVPVGLLHPGIARVLRLQSLPDDAFDEHWDGAAALGARFGYRPTTVESFVAARVADWRAGRA